MFKHKKEYLPHYTKADYEQWEGNWELIDGVPYVMSPLPGWYHQEINWKICSQVYAGLNGCTNCKVNMPINWQISEDQYVQPDVVVVCKPFEEGNFLTKTPEIIFELLSPATSEKDQTIKYSLYEKLGVKYYIIIWPFEKTAEIFILDNDFKYISKGRFSNETFHFETSGCHFDFDFSTIW